MSLGIFVQAFVMHVAQVCKLNPLVLSVCVVAERPPVCSLQLALTPDHATLVIVVLFCRCVARCSKLLIRFPQTSDALLLEPAV